MNKSDRELLLKDLCARLPYGVKVHCEWNLFQGNRISEDGELMSVNIYGDSINFKRNNGRITEIPFNRIDGTVLPYLRPMSSMTEEERIEWMGITHAQEWLIIGNLDKATDWLNSHHLDYHGLIPMGLALEAHEGMYSIK